MIFTHPFSMLFSFLDYSYKVGLIATVFIMVTGEELKKKLQDGLDASYLQVDDISPDMCGTSFSVVVVSKAFTGKSRLEQQRMVNELLAEEMTDIHAFTQKTYTPEAWERKNKT